MSERKEHFNTSLEVLEAKKVKREDKWKEKEVDVGLGAAQVTWVQCEMGKLHTAPLPSSGERCM